MALNWLEELVSQHYQMQGYLVSENIKVKMPKTESRNIQGNSDIDVLAIGETEVVHIECQSWYGPSTEQEKKFFKQLITRYECGKKHIKETYPFLSLENKKFKRVFVTSGKPSNKKSESGPWDRLEKHCNLNKIKLLEINDIIDSHIKLLKEKFPNKSSHIGKQEGVTRFLMHLIRNGFLKIE